MSKVFQTNYLFNLILFLWIVSIPFKNAIFQISIVLIILFFLVFLIKTNDYEYFKKLLLKYKDLVLIFFMLILSMTISNSINNVSGTKAWANELSFIYRYACVFIILIYFYSKGFFSKSLFVIFILLSISIQALDGVYQAIYGYDFFKGRIGDLSLGLTGSIFYRNIFGMITGVGIIISFYFIDKSKLFSRNNIMYMLLFSLFLFCTLFSYSRAVWVSLFLVLIIYLFLNLKNLKFIHIFVLCVFFVFLFSIIYNIESLYQRMSLLLEGNSAHRYEIWVHTINLIKEKVIFGWGLDTWKLMPYGSHNGTHNSILEILLYLGVFGFLIYSYFLFLILKEIYIKKDSFLFLIFIYFAIDSLFDQSITSGKVFLSSFTILFFFIFSNRINFENVKNN